MISAIGAEAQRFLHPLFGMSTALRNSRAGRPGTRPDCHCHQHGIVLRHSALHSLNLVTLPPSRILSNADTTTVSSLTPEVFGKRSGKNKLIVTYSNGFDPSKYHPLEVQTKTFQVPYFNPVTYQVELQHVPGYEVMLTPKAAGSPSLLVLRVVNPEKLDTWKPNPGSKSHDILNTNGLPTEGIAIQLHLTGKDAVSPVAFVYPPRTNKPEWKNSDYPRHLIVAGAGSRLYFTPSQGQPVQIAVGQEANPLPPDPYKPNERVAAISANQQLQTEILQAVNSAEERKQLLSETQVLLLLGGAATRFELTQLGQSKTQAPFMRHTVVNNANGISESTQLPVSLAQRMVYQVAKHGFRKINLHSANVSKPGIRQIHDFARHLNADAGFQTEFQNYLRSMGIIDTSWPRLKVGVLHEESQSNLGSGTATAIPLVAGGALQVQKVKDVLNQPNLNIDSPGVLNMNKPILVVPNDSFIRDVRLDLMLLDHARQKALFTLGVYPVEKSRVQAFGTLKVESPEHQYSAGSGKVVGFQEKLPLEALKNAYNLTEDPENYLCNTSIYVISPEGSQILVALHQVLSQDDNINLRSERGMVLDFGGDVFPAVVTLQSYLEKDSTGRIGLSPRGKSKYTEYLQEYKNLPNKPTDLSKEVKTNYRAMALYDQLTSGTNPVSNNLLEAVFEQPVYAHKFNGYWNDAGNLRDFIIAELAAAAGSEVKPDVSYLQKSADHLLLPSAKETLNHMVGAHQSVLVQPLAGNVMKMLRDYYGFASTGPVAVTGVVSNSELVGRTEVIQTVQQ
jgi:NDP-sugar pyrophosphorylase family protein